MKLNKYVLIDEYPDNDEVMWSIFTRPLYPIQYQNRWNKKVRFACSPSAINAFRLLKIKEAFPIEGDECFNVNEQKLHLKIIEQDTFGSYMLIIRNEKDELCLLYTGQFTNYRRVMINWLILDEITDMFVDNTLACSKNTNSLETACDTVQHLMKEYEGYKVYLDFENLFGYEELLVKLAQRKIKIQLHTLQMAAMRCGNNLQHFQFDGKPDLKVFYRPDRNNWNLKDYERFFNDDKCVYLKFIATEHTERIETKLKGIHYIVYSPHASKYTLAKFIRTIKPSRIHPLYLPVPIDDEWSNVIPNDIIPDSCELVIPIEQQSSEIDWNESLGQIQINARIENEQENSDSLSHLSQLRLLHKSSIQNNNNNNNRRRRKDRAKSFLAASSEEDDDNFVLMKANREAELASNPNEIPKSPTRILNDEPIEISDDDIELPPQIDNMKMESSIDIMSFDTTIAKELNSIHNNNDDCDQQTGNEIQLTENQNGNVMQPIDTVADAPIIQCLLDVIPNQTEKENRVNEVNNNDGQALNVDIEIARVHCHDNNVPSQATQSNQINLTQSRKKLMKRNALSLWQRETKLQKIQYLPETDEESGDDNDIINDLDSSSDTLSPLSPLNFDSS